jgi:hypothetical protein
VLSQVRQALGQPLELLLTAALLGDVDHEAGQPQAHRG